jgi:DNA-binding CsgD family transcriptional regulator
LHDLDDRARSGSTLSPEAQHLVGLGAVLGTSFCVDDVAELVGEPVAFVTSALDEALDTRLLAPAGDAVGFRDRRMRAAVYRGVTEPMRDALRRRIGWLLLTRGGSDAAAAAHLSVGASPAGTDVLAGLDQAVRDLLATSPAIAADLALRAFELTTAEDPNRTERAATAVSARAAAGQLDDAVDFTTAALTRELFAPAAAARLRLELASILMANGRADAARSETEAAMGAVDLPDDLHVRAEVTRRRALLAENDVPRVRRAAETILAGADRDTAHEALAGGLTALGWIAWGAARVTDATALVRAATQQTDVADVDAGGVHPSLDLAFMLTATGDFDEASALVETASGPTVLASILRSRLKLAAGRLDDAVTDALVGLTDAPDDESFFPAMALSSLAEVALLRGDLELAWSFLRRRGAEHRPLRAGFAPDPCAWIEGRLVAAGGDVRHAVDVLAPIYDDLPGHRRLLVEHPGAAAWLVRTAIVAGADTRAAAVVACADLLAADNRSCPSILAAATHAHGVLDADVTALEYAGSAHRHTWAQASAFEDAGAVLAPHDRVRARGDLDQARERYERMGAYRDAGRVQARLRGLEGTRDDRRRTRPRWGWESLTPSEYRVAALVAEGLTNRSVAERMYLSRHTVDFHLRQIFRKLDVSSRVGLTRVVLDHEEHRPTRSRDVVHDGAARRSMQYRRKEVKPWNAP